jgi:nucleotide-binding universal stress UspA family protein
MIAAILLVLGLGLGSAAGLIVARRRTRAAPRRAGSGRHILLPFTGTTVSNRAVEAALRLAQVEDATLMPAFLATVPRTSSLDSPLPRQCEVGMPLLEALEQRAAAQGTPVDARIERGRSYRHALSRLLEREQFDRIIVSASAEPGRGLSGDDVLWVLEHAPAEVLVLRPAPEDHRVVSGARIAGHF